MRFVMALLAVLGMTIMSPAVLPAAAAADSSYALTLDQQPSGKLDINIDVNEGGGDWWANPIWIGIGAVGVLLLIVLIVLAARGGGTTVVKG